MTSPAAHHPTAAFLRASRILSRSLRSRGGPPAPRCIHSLRTSSSALASPPPHPAQPTPRGASPFPRCSPVNSLNARSFSSRPPSWKDKDDKPADKDGKEVIPAEGAEKKPKKEKSKKDNAPERKDEKKDDKASADADAKSAKTSDAAPAAAAAAAGGSGDGEGTENLAEKILAENPNGSTTEINANALTTVTVPKEYPQLLAIPLNRRPLFPGFYKSLFIKDPEAIAAIQDLMAREQPYIGIFLSKNDELEDDVISDVSQVHRVGVFAQITNVYQAGPDNQALTVVVFPHRRIRMNNLLPLPVLKNAGADQDKKPEKIETDGVEVIEPNTEELPEGYLPINRNMSNFRVSLADVENMEDQPFNPQNGVVKAITSETLNVLKEISNINPLLRDQIITFSIQTGGSAFADPAKLADFAAAVSTGEPNELQSVLDSLVIEERMMKSLAVVKNELNNARLQQDIAKAVDKKITRRQQEYFLMEQLKGIKKELGIDGDGRDKLIDKFKQRAEKLAMPEAVKKVFDEEVTKLQTLEPAASEFNVTRNYLDWLTQIPWGQYSKENFDIKHAIEVLDEDHYGLKDVKDRILEFIAVGKLRGTVEGKIICLQGPPGVGKTSIGKSIARALGREFFRFSVGGLTDVAEIKGHRRTYVGAMPGKVVQALKKVQTENPLIMIDEIDKLGRGHQGDPASALLELLDPEQNNSFLDHYMDIPLDLSKVLFVCTANMLDTIPAPLLDRMEVIRLSGYVAEEKVAIAEKYLAPASREAAGIKPEEMVLTPGAIELLIRYYCREAGVRNLKKQIDKIYRKTALKIVREEEPVEQSEKKEGEKKVGEAEIGVPAERTSPATPFQVTAENLKDFVGSPVFTSDRMYEVTPPGVVMGLAWTSMGGTALYIESVLESTLTETSKPSFARTGQMGDVMKESSTIAYTYAKSFMAKRFPKNTFFDRAQVHLHVPEGATPKDGKLKGKKTCPPPPLYVRELAINLLSFSLFPPKITTGPSAGSTMATSLLSLALDTPLIQNVAMTGELTVTGKVLKIGGVKEKTIAAKRSGVTTVIFPEANRADWDELDAYLKEGLDAKFVGRYEEVFEVVFPGL
ncbi:ATP-dependent Lon protease pim1 [Thoreauomyces humboldtii]|nr:ATP-dependent Lon protease pim1 [Thoreauomyces humboldtii]